LKGRGTTENKASNYQPKRWVAFFSRKTEKMQKLCRELHTDRLGGRTKWQFPRNLGNANLPLVKEIVKKSSRIQHLVLHEENQQHPGRVLNILFIPVQFPRVNKIAK